MSTKQRPHATPSPHSAEESLGSGRVWQPTQEGEKQCEPRTPAASAHPKKLHKNTAPTQQSIQQEEHSEIDENASDDQDEDGKKTSQGPRFSDHENLALVEGVEKFYDRLYGRLAQTTASRDKLRFWQEISNRVTAVSAIRRDPKHCKKIYSDCLRQTKKKMALLQCHEQATGGGPKVVSRWFHWEEIIRARLNPIMVGGIPGRVDSHSRRQNTEEDAPTRPVVRQERPTTGPPKPAKHLGISGSKRPRAEEIDQPVGGSTTNDVSAGMFEALDQPGGASCIGPYFHPDLLQQNNDEDEEPGITTRPSAIASQVQVVADTPQDKSPRRMRQIRDSASQMEEWQTGFHDVVDNQLNRMKRIQEKLLSSLEQDKRNRQQDQGSIMETLRMMTTLVDRLVINSTSEVERMRIMCDSQSQAAANLHLIATSLQRINERLDLPEGRRISSEIQQPSPAQAPYLYAPSGPWCGPPSQHYQSFPDPCHMYQHPPPSTSAPTPGTGTAPPSAPTPQESVDWVTDQDFQSIIQE
ncbi:uncharacterized protein LOC135054583 [Pseudophryne corroboree]|uniref:uncharacterized protein LOC135054583 n=1 Tax=Pseudophryne corroboree TaxID=495146 RepID=UPI003081C747